MKSLSPHALNTPKKVDNVAAPHTYSSTQRMRRTTERDGVQFTSLPIAYSTAYWRCRSKKTSKLRVTGLCEGNSPVTGEFPKQLATNVEYASIWWRHHATDDCFTSSIRNIFELSFTELSDALENLENTHSALPVTVKFLI